MLFIFSTPALIRHLWQLKTVVSPTLVSNMCCSMVAKARVKAMFSVTVADGFVLNFANVNSA